MLDKIVIRGARQHNLKNIDLELPRGKVIVITGVSGSGKSSLAFDTIYAEGQRRYIESLSTYARQFIEKLERPDIDSISGISPTIAIRQKNTVTSARSTVGTSTEIYDYLRLLFARIGVTICPYCGIPVESHSPTDVALRVIEKLGGKRVYLLAPVEAPGGDEFELKRSYLLSRGFSKVLSNGEAQRIDEIESPESTIEELYVVLDRVRAVEENRGRIAESVELAYREPGGKVKVTDESGKEYSVYTLAPTCSGCGRHFDPPSPLLFSFNSPYGACPACRGFGDRMEFSEDLIVPDKGLSLAGRAIDPWSRDRFSHFYRSMMEFCREKGIPLDSPYRDLGKEARDLIMETDCGEYTGVLPFLRRMREKSYKKGHRFFTRRYMAFQTCRSCEGTRLRSEALNVWIDGRRISDVCGEIPSEILKFLDNLPLTDFEAEIAGDVLAELKSRLSFMVDVGLNYLTLYRLTRTLSGGEAQRINLANSLGANLVDAVYVLDEPSIGLHAADNEKLISVMKKLKKLGNTVIVVEHDPDIILASDHLVDLGPGPGKRGGEVLVNCPVSKAGGLNVRDSETLKWIFGNRRKADVTRKRIIKPSGRITLKGVTKHNIMDVDVDFPLGCFVCVTGVSGSGKSTLVVDVLYKLLSKRKGVDSTAFLREWNIEGRADRAVLVDQSPIGMTPRSNPITYIKGFSHIREAFANRSASIARGYRPGRFSFNKSGGRCPRCLGMGYRRVEMHFMADVFVPCEECGGKRYNKETLEIRFKGLNISEILDLTVEEAIMFFDKDQKLGEKLWMLSRVGLGYIKLGQPSNTLSGGEAQRIKIARELAEAGGERNIYIMDEPTTGLHMSDVERLLQVLGDLVSSGQTVIVIEHNMDVIANSDYVIDLGPGGGGEGGRVIACGSPQKIVSSKRSKTAEYLRARGTGLIGRDK